MGSGKTTVGQLLAQRLGRPFCDSDEMIEARTGHTVRQIFLAQGEPAFRALETTVLSEALTSTEPNVIAAAGGVVISAQNRNALTHANALVVWLRADPEVLTHRVLTGGHRPLLDDNPEQRLRELLNARESLYREVANIVVDVSSATPEQIADEIMAAVA